MKIKTPAAAIAAVILLTACTQISQPLENRAGEPPVPTATAATETTAPDTAAENPAGQAVETGIAEAPAAAPPENTIPAPVCSGELTPSQMEGPYYSEGAPESGNLIQPELGGTQILLYGWVLDTDCSPIPGARVEIWQADANGEYDNESYTLRGYVLTDENGFYEIATIEPGIYPGRPPHIHAKVIADGGRELLTTQLYFPGSEDSSEVRTYPQLLVTYQDPNTDGLVPVLFSFIVNP